MKRRSFHTVLFFRRALAVLSVAVLVLLPGGAVAAADTAVLAPPRPGGMDLAGQLDPKFLAELKAIEAKVLQEQQQAQQLTQQKQAEEAKIQAHNQKSAAVRQKAAGWNGKAAALNQEVAALQVRINAHNAKPNTFRLPQQQAAYAAYNAEAAQLRAAQSQMQARQSALNAEKAATTAEQNQVNGEGQQLEQQKQQLNQRITAHNNGMTALQSQMRNLLEQMAAALQQAATAPQENGQAADLAAGGDQGRPAKVSADTGRAGNDGGDPSSPKAIRDALTQYGQAQGVTVHPQPVRVLLTPGTVKRLAPDKAAGLAPYRSYDGLILNPGGTFTALQVVAPGAPPDPVSQAINDGGQATAFVDGRMLNIIRVQPVPGGLPTGERPKKPVDCGPQGWDRIQATDAANGNRAQGITACLNRGYLASHTGTPASAQPPGYQWAQSFATSKGLSQTRNINACHLLGKQLGGSGSDLRNLSPCARSANASQRDSQQYRFNHMALWENQIKAVIDSGDAQVLYSVTPRYAGNRTVPTGYHVTVQGTYPDGTPAIGLNAIVPNILSNGYNLGTQTDAGVPVPTAGMP
ncbi:DNA/RNA non-specific endonuclease [Crossiella sp. SN42]|uniref:DNA/RNA non-specific endonuclease n=1 Tax=Crossiella sp. SN42 TaxID=2944808 RepID=UPI00207C3A9D|nr:DNA/RNA non-specific endonuclease [Crossiella sp. SN42]MCO1577212.1 DNA/RNA non-specific endonuclease [Crossiella sp. SN42]